MNGPTNRRRFLAALGTGTVALAGCSALNEQMPEGGGSSNNSSGGSSNGNESDNGGQTQAPPPAIQQGEVIDDFENLDGWTAYQGQLSADGDAALTGSQAARIENQGTTAGILQAFPDGLDVSGRNLSMALRVDTPRPAYVTVQLRAPARSATVQSRRTVVDTYQGWLRMDLGYTSQRGEPNLQNVQEIRIFLTAQGNQDQTQTQNQSQSQNQGSEIRFFVDDFRATPSASQGYVVLTFDDGVESQYANGLPLLQERSMPATAAVNANSLNVPGRLSMGQLREMRDAGWDIASHPENGFQEMNTEQIRSSIQSNKEFLTNRGFPDGARHMFVPYHNTNQEIVDITREYHDTSAYFAGTTSAVPFTDPMHLSRIDMSDVEGFTGLVDLAAQYNQLLIGYAHGVGNGELDNMTQQQLTQLLDYLAQSDVQVVTPSYLLDNQGNL